MQHRESPVFRPTCSGVLGQAWCCSTLDICTPLALVSVEGFQCIPLWRFLLALPPSEKKKQDHTVDNASTIWWWWWWWCYLWSNASGAGQHRLQVLQKVQRMYLQGQCTWPWDVRRGQGRQTRWIGLRWQCCRTNFWRAAASQTPPQTLRKTPGTRWWRRKQCRRRPWWTTWQRRRRKWWSLWRLGCAAQPAGSWSQCQLRPGHVRAPHPCTCARGSSSFIEARWAPSLPLPATLYLQASVSSTTFCKGKAAGSQMDT